MIDELFLYDRDKGLFKEILSKSKIIKGRYHVSPNYGHDLNTNNLDQFLKDPAYGQLADTQKYPICVCLTPGSRFTKINGQKWEEFYFSLFFLTTAFQTGTNQIKKIDRDTNTSGQHPWYDWSDMKQCAADFIELLRLVILKKLVGTVPIKTLLNIEFERAQIVRITKFNNDRLNGAAVNFTAFLRTDACELKDYDAGVLDTLDIPPLNIEH